MLLLSVKQIKQSCSRHVKSVIKFILVSDQHSYFQGSSVSACILGSQTTWELMISYTAMRVKAFPVQTWPNNATPRYFVLSIFRALILSSRQARNIGGLLYYTWVCCDRYLLTCTSLLLYIYDITICMYIIYFAIYIYFLL